MVRCDGTAHAPPGDEDEQRGGGDGAAWGTELAAMRERRRM
jgi:hypothetical protein